MLCFTLFLGFVGLQWVGRKVYSRTVQRGSTLSNHYPVAILLLLISFFCLWLSGLTFPREDANAFPQAPIISKR